jgi:APA family basic amino acid/polyamine antiporter
MGRETISTLGGTTALLLLGVFAVVNVAVLVLRRHPIDREHFVAPTVVPILGALCCAYLAGPWTGRSSAQYGVAGALLVIGVVLWAITWTIRRAGARG